MIMRIFLFLAMGLGIGRGALALAAPQNPHVVTAQNLPLPVNHSNPQPIQATPLVNGNVTDSILESNDDLPDYHCDGENFGYEPPTDSCYGALEIMPISKVMHSFGHGPGTDMVELPYRVSSPDGRCAIEVRLKENLWYTGRDVASFRELKEGALTVFAGCLIRERTGGVSRYQGMNKRLEVTVEKYNPHNVRCGTRATPGPPKGSCLRLIEYFWPSKYVFTYGRKGDEGVILPLPYQKRYPRRGPSCLITINTIGGIDRASSYDFFKAAVAVEMICARNQPPLQGIATGIGEDKQLTISLSNGEGSELADSGGGGESVDVA